MPTVDELIDQLFTPEGPSPYELSSKWTPAVHRQVLARLELASPATLIVTRYINILKSIEGESSGTSERRDDEILQLVAMWRTRWADEKVEIPKRMIPPAETILTQGLASATRRYDRTAAAAWWPELRALQPKQPLKKHVLQVAMPTFFDGGHDRCTDCIERMNKFVAGGYERECEELMAGASAPSAPLELTDEQLALVCWVRRGPRFVRTIFRDPGGREIWFRDATRTLVVFDGTTFQPPSCGQALADSGSTAAATLVEETTRCDERVVMWSGKHEYAVFQRYGRHLLFLAGAYFQERGGAEMIDRVWLSWDTAERATAEMQRLSRALPASFKRIDPWFDKTGSVLREYGSYGLSIAPASGVWGARWVGKDGTVVREFESRDEAVSTFESVELETLRAGNVFHKFRRVKPVDG